MNPHYLFTEDAPRPIGPYSQAVECGGLIFISGQIPLDPKTGEICGDTTEGQAEQVLGNLRAILRAQALDFSSLVKTTVFLTDIQDFPAFNRVYSSHLQKNAPARSVVQVSRLPKGVKVEIEAVACR